MSVHSWLEAQGMNVLTCGFECVWWCVVDTCQALWHLTPVGYPVIHQTFEGGTWGWNWSIRGVWTTLCITYNNWRYKKQSGRSVKNTINSFTKCSWANAVITFNYVFHNLAPYTYQGCLFHTQSWYYHLLPMNLFTCGMYNQVFLRIPQVFSASNNLFTSINDEYVHF